MSIPIITGIADECGVDNLHARIMNLPADPKVLAKMDGSPKGFYLLGHRDARHAAAELVAAHGAAEAPAPAWREFLWHWIQEGHLQTFEDRERFRKAARELLAADGAKEQP